MDKINISVWGCCVSRDSLDFRRDKYLVTSYVQAVSPLTFSTGIPLNISLETFNEYPYISNFVKRCICLDANKNAIEYMAQKKGDWLLFDIAEVRRYCYKWITDHGDILLTENSNLNKMLSCLEGFTDGVARITIKPQLLSQDLVIDKIEALCDAILKIYRPEQIIINEFYNSLHILGKDNIIRNFEGEPISVLVKQNELLKTAYEVCKRKFEGCYIINMPENNFSDEKQRWGASSLHFTGLYYDYAEKCISVIAGEESRSVKEYKLKELYSLFNEKMLTNRMWAAKNWYAEEKHRLADELKSSEDKLKLLNDQVQKLQFDNKFLMAHSEKEHKKLQSVEKQLNEITNSRSYKLGRALTWLPRKLRGVFRKK